jgi:hypothetical protein
MAVTKEDIIRVASYEDAEKRGGFVCSNGELEHMDAVLLKEFMQSLGFDVVYVYKTSTGDAVATSRDGYNLFSSGYTVKKRG